MSPRNDACNEEAVHGREFLHITQVAERYGISVATVRRNSKSGVMPAGLLIGHARRWRRGELDAWDADGCKPVR